MWWTLPAVAVAADLTLPPGVEAAGWRAEMALVEARLDLPEGRIEVAPDPVGWRLTVTGPSGGSHAPIRVAATATGIREGLWLAAAILLRSEADAAAPLPLPPPPAPDPPASRSADRVSEPAPDPPAPDPPTLERIVAPPVAEDPPDVPSSPAALPPPDRGVSGSPSAPEASLPPEPPSPWEVAGGVAIGSDASWIAGVKVGGRQGWALGEGRAEIHQLRNPSLAEAVGVSAGRQAWTLQIGGLAGWSVAGGPTVRIQIRPEGPSGRWSPHLGLGASGRVHFVEGSGRVTLRLDLVGEPRRESRTLFDPDGDRFEVLSPTMFVSVGVDLGVALRALSR